MQAWTVIKRASCPLIENLTRPNYYLSPEAYSLMDACATWGCLRRGG
jgi:hypothetical protein